MKSSYVCWCSGAGLAIRNGKSSKIHQSKHFFRFTTFKRSCRFGYCSYSNKNRIFEIYMKSFIIVDELRFVMTSSSGEKFYFKIKKIKKKLLERSVTCRTNKLSLSFFQIRCN